MSQSGRLFSGIENNNIILKSTEQSGTDTKIIVKYNSLLNSLEQSIASVQSNIGKRAIATKKLSKSAVDKFAAGEITLEQALTAQPEDKYDVTHALALAICLGKVETVKQFLEFFDKDSINDFNNFVWGYRQPYSFMHLAAHPQVHIAVGYSEKYADSMIAIIKLLGNCEANPNLVKEDELYTNPAIAAGQPMGHTYDNKNINRIRGSLLLIGANPDYVGSSFRIYKSDRQDAIQEAGKQYLAMTEEERQKSLALFRHNAVVAIDILASAVPANPAPILVGVPRVSLPSLNK